MGGIVHIFNIENCSFNVRKSISFLKYCLLLIPCYIWLSKLVVMPDWRCLFLSAQKQRVIVTKVKLLSHFSVNCDAQIEYYMVVTRRRKT